MSKKKCQWCKEWIENDIVEEMVGEKLMHFCSTKCRDQAIMDRKSKDEYKQICDITKDIFGYEFCSFKLLGKELATWEKLANREKILAYLIENKEQLSSIMNKEFDGNFSRVRYYGAVVKQKLHDFKPKVKEIVIEKKTDTTFYDVSDVVNRTNTRRALDDLEDEV